MSKHPTHPKTHTKQFFRFDPVTTILLLAGVFIASQVAAALIAGLYPALRDWTEAQSRAWVNYSVEFRFAYVVITSVLSIAAILQLVRLAQVTKERIGLVRPKLRDVGWSFVAYGLYFLCFLIAVIGIRFFMQGVSFEQRQQTGFESAFTGGEVLMTFLSLVVIVPVAEEIMFRGFLFSSLRAQFRLRYAVIITSLLFGLAHLQFREDAPVLWLAAVDTFILSCFLCYLRERFDSVWPAVFLHAIKNGVAFILLFGDRLLL